MAVRLLQTQSAATNLKKFTFSCWIKRSKISSSMNFFVSHESASDEMQFRFNSNDTLEFTHYPNYGSTGYQGRLITNRVFRDVSGWYNIVIAYDSAQATNSNRLKMYVNGVQETSFSTTDYPDQNTDGAFGTSSYQFCIGTVSPTSTGDAFDGLMSHAIFTDGYVYDASTFGSTDSTTGEWKINTSPSVTYGNNGFFILKDSASVTDQSGNSNNFTVSSGTITSTKDCPSNVFATWNNLARATAAGIQANGIGNGNTYIATVAQNDNYSFASTLAFPGTGKFYMEFKVGNIGTDYAVGIGEVEAMLPSLQSSNPFKYCNNAKGWAYTKSGNKETGGSGSSYGNSFTSYDYIGLAYNNGALWFSKNGTWQNNATISEINAGTTTYAAFTGIDTSAQYFIMFAGYNDAMIEMNAGNGAFRGTQAGSNNPSSGDTGALFKYTVPTGYQPLSTKGLNS